MPPGDVLAAMVLFLTIGTVGAIVVPRGPLGRALADRIAGGHLRDPGADPRTDLLDGQADVRERAVHDLGDVHRLGEVEERQDFTERMIAQRADPGRMGSSTGER